jgi:hypothetical protein
MALAIDRHPALEADAHTAERRAPLSPDGASGRRPPQPLEQRGHGPPRVGRDLLAIDP